MKEEPQNNSTQDNDAPVNHSSNVLESLRLLIKDSLSLKDLSEPELTINGIKKDIEFKGFNLWILIFSILICSIGLNANSGAVVIGAMLISPLMGPIMGLGLSVGINDTVTLKKSLKSLATAVIVAVLTSFIFFLLVPLGNDHSELLARTRPDIRDVFIGVFGGLTGILAGSRKEKTNVIPGVAIATALMPPLCTAGYGLASGHYEYFLGAFYLFLINSFFISLATLLVVRYLKFPVATFLSKDKEKKGKRIIVLATVIIIVPSVYIFVNVVRDSVFENQAREYVQNVIHYNGTIIRNEDVNMLYTDSARVIQVFALGNQIPEEIVDGWRREVRSTFKNTYLDFVQNGEQALAFKEELSGRIELIEGANRLIYQKDQEILSLKREVSTLRKYTVPRNLGSELLEIFPLLNRADFGAVTSQSNGGRRGEFVIVNLHWAADSLISDSVETNRVESFLKLRLPEDSVMVFHQ